MNNSHMRGLASQPQPSDQADDEWKLERVAGVDGWPPHALIEEWPASEQPSREKSCDTLVVRRMYDDTTLCRSTYPLQSDGTPVPCIVQAVYVAHPSRQALAEA